MRDWSRAPPNFTRTMPNHYRHLCLEHRHTIHALRKLGFNLRQIAEEIGFDETTVGREVRRNSGLKGYRPLQAQKKASERRANSRRERVISGGLEAEVEARLRSFHSPEQISGQLKEEGFGAPSHQSIYGHVARDRRSGGDLYLSLRRGGKRYRRNNTSEGRGKIPHRTGIEERPPSVEKRTRYGHWEADLVEGSKGTGFVLALYERKTQTYLVAKISDKKAATVADAMVRRLKGWKVLTITYDNGLEFAGHVAVGRELGARSYFCNPYHSWEKGGVENANGLLRQYLPKGMSFGGVDDDLLSLIEDEINERPRKLLGYKCPMDYLTKLVTAA